MSTDTWIPLSEFPGYAAAADGRVRGPKGQELRAFVNGTHGPAVNVYRAGEVVRLSVARIKEMVASEQTGAPLMTRAEAAEILRLHNRWRRGDDEDLAMQEPRLIGLAMDLAIAALSEKGMN
jgi:hypothetical protein